MSIEALKFKPKINEIQTGVHLLCISDMFYLKEGKALKKIGGHPVIIVHFREGKNKLHEQMYIIDGHNALLSHCKTRLDLCKS